MFTLQTYKHFLIKQKKLTYVWVGSNVNGEVMKTTVKELNDLDCHCHTDIVLEKEHAELDVCYREQLEGILRLYHLENKK